MQIDGIIQALREDLARIAALGDENTSRAAELLSVALESSLGRRLQDALAEAALELNDQLECSHVELRVAGHDLQLVLVREDGSMPEQADEAFSARITLRLPESLKQRVESAATREGASVNTWLVQALQRAVERAARRPRAEVATASPATAATEKGERDMYPDYTDVLKLREPLPPRPAPGSSRQRDPAPRQAADPGVPLMLEQTFHTPLPLELEVGIPSGDIEVETTEGEESNITVDGDDRLLEEVEIRHDGNRVVVTYHGKGKFGFSLSPLSLVFGSELRVRATVPHGAGVKVKTASADTRLDGHFGSVGVNSVSGDLRVRGEIAGNATVKTVSGDADLDRVDGDMSAQTVSGDLRIGPVAGSAETKTVSGDIRFQSVTAGDVRFTSVSGDIEIGIAQGSAVDVDAGSTSGDLSSEVPLGERAPVRARATRLRPSSSAAAPSAAT